MGKKKMLALFIVLSFTIGKLQFDKKIPEIKDIKSTEWNEIKTEQLDYL